MRVRRGTVAASTTVAGRKNCVAAFGVAPAPLWTGANRLLAGRILLQQRCGPGICRGPGTCDGPGILRLEVYWREVYWPEVYWPEVYWPGIYWREVYWPGILRRERGRHHAASETQTD